MISLKNIDKTYVSGSVETPALRGISLEIQEGEFVAIIGPSGSGKSTLMNIIGMLDTPTAGIYVFDGQDVSTLSDDELATIRSHKIGFVFQSFNLLPRTNVERNVVLPLVYSEEPDALRNGTVHTALIAAGLPEDQWGKLSNQLSGGQMQRVAIARALVNDPRLILADEPTGNLDTKTSEVILQTFERLNRQDHRTIILITHEPYIAARADRIIRMQDGKIVEDSKTQKSVKAAHYV